MKKASAFISIVAAFGIMSGCAGHGERINSMGSSTRQDVFKQVAEDAAPVLSYADLQVYSSLKTHKPGLYSKKDVHGTSDYKLLMNIDGQAIELVGVTSAENKGTRSLRDPEAGEGIRFQFGKKLRLQPGTHKVVLAIPADDLVVEQELSLLEGKNQLTLEPIYGASPEKPRPGLYGVTSHMQGIKRLQLILNGKAL